jgi:hypothetical protein
MTIKLADLFPGRQKDAMDVVLDELGDLLCEIDADKGLAMALAARLTEMDLEEPDLPLTPNPKTADSSWVHG